MAQMTERAAKWMKTVEANFAGATGQPVETWVARARRAGVAKDTKAARTWLREKQGFTTVQTSLVLMALFPESEDDEELVGAQFSGKKASLRPVYDRLAEAARALGKDVMIAPRKSQVTFARHVTFAVVRAATATRVDLLLRLRGVDAAGRLKGNPRATGSDPTHAVALSSAKEVDAEVRRWMKLAYQMAAR
jgi:hypothetical protein